MKRIAILSALVGQFMLGGCGTSQRLEAGVKASDAPRVFQQIKRNAQARNLETVEHTGEIAVKAPDGSWLWYIVFGSDVALVVLTDEGAAPSQQQVALARDLHAPAGSSPAVLAAR
jgi:hypothetical protein